MLLTVTIASIFGLTEHGSVWWVVAAPIFVWELSFGVYLVLKGFKPSPVTDGLAASTGHQHKDVRPVHLARFTGRMKTAPTRALTPATA